MRIVALASLALLTGCVTTVSRHSPRALAAQGFHATSFQAATDAALLEIRADATAMPIRRVEDPVSFEPIFDLDLLGLTRSPLPVPEPLPQPTPEPLPQPLPR